VDGVAVTKGEGQAPGRRPAAARSTAASGTGTRSTGEQGTLFGDESAAVPEDVGYRGPTACTASGISYRQLDYWARTGLVEPSVRGASGSGSQRLYGFRDILVLKVVKRLLDTGISLQQIRAAVSYLREQGTDDLAGVTLMSDGVSVYECTSPDEVVDLLQGGQGVFGIALGSVWREVEGSLADLPAEHADGTGLAAAGVPGPGAAPGAPPAGADEFTRHRARKTG
jgi:DNA-binding transcriptional MerR regulator